MSAGRPPASTFLEPDGIANHIKKTHPRIYTGKKAKRDVILPTLRKCAIAHEAGLDYDGSRAPGSGGHNKKMDVKDCSHDDAMAVGMISLNKGLGMRRAVQRTNAVRARQQKEPVGKDVLRRIRDELGGKRRAKPRSSQGSRDENSAVSTAWVGFGGQIMSMLAAGKRKREGGKQSKRKRKKTAAAVTSAEQGSVITESEFFGEMDIDGTAFFDQHHAYQFEEHGDGMQTLIPMHPITGRPCPVRFGGVMPPVQTKKKLKFAGQIRVDCGIAAPTDKKTGERMGVKSGMWFYGGSGQGNLLYAKDMDKRIEAENLRVKGKKGVWKKYNSDNPYEERYGKGWLKKMKATSKFSQIFDVRDLMDWTLEQCTEMFKGSTHEDDWWVARDGLKQWWADEAQEYAKKIGLYKHQLRCTGSTCK